MLALKKTFIVYPKTKINMDDPYYEKVDTTLKIKLKTFITGYIEDYGESPSITYIQSIFNISKLDVEIALSLYGSAIHYIDKENKE